MGGDPPRTLNLPDSTMLANLIGRFLQGIFVLFVLFTVTFFLIKALPGGGSQVQWRIELDAAVPGAAFVIKQLLGIGIGRGLKKLA